MYKKIITLFISAAMSLLLCIGANAQEDYDGYVYFTIERLTLGQGFAVEPTKVGFYKTDMLIDIAQRFLGDKCVITRSSYGDYISGIKDGGEPKGWTSADIPKPVMEKLITVGERYEPEILTDEDYPHQVAPGEWQSSSGWSFTIDDVSLSLGASSISYGEDTSTGEHFANNSVVRLQYTMYGYGMDIGGGWGVNEFADVNTFADKSALIKKMADINYANEQADYGKSYTAAMMVLEDWDATAYEIQNAVNNLRKTVKITKTETDAQITLDVVTTEKTDIYVAFYNSDFTLKAAKLFELSVSDKIECKKEGSSYKIFVWYNMFPLESEIQ